MTQRNTMFTTGKPVTGKDFIDRKKHLPLFKTYIDQCQNIVIKAPRRFGKTSLVKHLLENSKYTLVYIDIKREGTLNSLADKIINKAYELSKIKNFIRQSKESLLTLLKQVQKIKIDALAEVTLSYQENPTKDGVDYFLHSLDILNDIAKKENINVKFALDEFQDILEMADKSILDKTRSVMQHHTHITYIFLGSIESMMRSIFEIKNSPFFHFSSIIELPPLDIDELFIYANGVFKSKRISCPRLEEFLIYLGGHPDYSLQFLQKLYFHALSYEVQTLDDTMTYEIFINMILDNKAYLDELITKAKQKKHHVELLIEMAQNKKSTLEAKSLYNVRKSLEEMGLIRSVSQGNYVIVDILLRIILSQTSDTIVIESLSPNREITALP